MEACSLENLLQQTEPSDINPHDVWNESDLINLLNRAQMGTAAKP